MPWHKCENSTNRTLLRKWWKQRKLQSIVYDYVHHLGCLKSAPPWISLLAPKSSSYSCCLPVHWAPWALLEGSHPPIPRPPITRDCPHFSLTAPPCPEHLSRAVKLVKGNHSLLLARNPALQSRQWRIYCWGPLELWIQWKMYICWKDVIPSDTRDCTGIAKYCLRCQWWRR